MPARTHRAALFVFRKYLDFGAINAMRDLHAQIRREVARKDMADHIKLGPGGIREIEFMAQVFQLIRGGRDPALQIRPTLKVLPLLVARRLLPEDSETELFERLRIPAPTRTSPAVHQRRADAHAADHERGPRTDRRVDGVCRLACAARVLDVPRARRRHFEQIFSEPEEGAHGLSGLWLEQIDGDDALEAVPNSVSASQARCSIASRGPSARVPSTSSCRRKPRTARCARSAPDRSIGGNQNAGRNLAARPRFLRGRSSTRRHLALLQQYPQTLTKQSLKSSAVRCGPRLPDAPPDPARRSARPAPYDVATDWNGFISEMQFRLSECASDTEREMDILRETHHAQVFRLLAGHRRSG